MNVVGRFCALLVNFAPLLALLALTCAWLEQRRSKQIQIKLRAQLEEAQQILRQRSQLATEVAHEIKNPLTAILCSAETLDLLIGESLDQINRNSLRYIREYGTSVLALLSDFLDLCKVEQGAIKVQTKAVGLTQVVRSVFGLLEASAQSKKVTLHLKELKCAEVWAEVDNRHIRQILFNLVHNAIKFSGKAEQVLVELKTDPIKNQVLIIVEDRGIGIAKEDQKIIFDPYVQASSAAKLSRHGTGLGLAICKSLVELNQGEIELESQQGFGSTFTVRLPIAKPVSVSEQSKNIEKESTESHSGLLPLDGRSILIVDDDDGARLSMTRLIEAWGGVVDNVRLASEAVDALCSKHYDTILIDQTADGLCADQMSRLIRDECHQHESTIILASTKESDPDFLRKSGADCAISKPLDGKKLLASLVQTGKSCFSQ